ncbi:MAG: DUF3298 domain-containing protein [Lachnospiraceae bacterium]|nr:DUF3298 domain-containing protein [Lachnospiraceae bacterium]
MKRKKLLILLLSSCLTLTACGGGSANTGRGDNHIDASANENTENGDTDSDEKNEDGNQEQTSSSDAEASGGDFNAENAGTDFEVSVDFKDQSDEKMTDEGYSIFYSSYSLPVVTMNQYKDSEKKINAFFENEIQQFKENASELVKEAKSEYENLNDEERELFYGYSSHQYYEKSRMDEKVISFMGYSYLYLGGAHDSSLSSAYNFDTKTGEKLKLSDLFEDEQTAMNEIREYILSLCSNPYYSVRLFEDYEENIDDVLKDDNWFFDEDGLHFISNTYVLGPYAAGEFDFVIPYENLTQLKDAYAYNGSYLYPSLINESVNADLDGNGKKDTINLSIDRDILEKIYSGNWEDPVDPVLTVTINDKDYSDVMKESMNSLSYNFNQNYYIVDLDTSKPGMELMFIDIYDNDYCLTYFYEYKDEKLTFLGSVQDRLGYDSFHINGDGTVSARLPLNLLQTSSADVTYRLKDDQLVIENQDWYYVNDSMWNDEYKHHAILQEVTVYTEPDLSSQTKVLTPEDGKVSFPATDNEHWYMLKTENGETYYLYLEDFSTVPNNGNELYAPEIFENLFLAG